jgi:gas vesicle protein
MKEPKHVCSEIHVLIDLVERREKDWQKFFDKHEAEYTIERLRVVEIFSEVLESIKGLKDEILFLKDTCQDWNRFVEYKEEEANKEIKSIEEEYKDKLGNKEEEYKQEINDVIADYERQLKEKQKKIDSLEKILVKNF